MEVIYVLKTNDQQLSSLYDALKVTLEKVTLDGYEADIHSPIADERITNLISVINELNQAYAKHLHREKTFTKNLQENARCRLWKVDLYKRDIFHAKSNVCIFLELRSLLGIKGHAHLQTFSNLTSFIPSEPSQLLSDALLTHLND